MLQVARPVIASRAMRIGLKLNVDFDSSDVYRDLFGGRDVLSCLVELGVEAVEIPLTPSSDLSEVAEKAHRCHLFGLNVSFHPYTENHDSNPAHFDGPDSLPATMHQRFLGLAHQLTQSQGKTVVNIHPAAGANGFPRNELVERSVQFFSWAQSWCADNAPEVQPVAELQLGTTPNEQKFRVGDSPVELTQIVQGSGVQACWDVGHAVINHQRFGTTQDPTAELWKRIAHVHCHGVDDEDHRILRSGDSEWRRFLEELKGKGFSGTVVVEVSPQTFLDAGGLTAVEESIAALSEAVR